MNEFLQFAPILKEKIWGGEKLKSLLNKETKRSNIGESWEISGVKANISVVSRGRFKGKTLEDLLKDYKDRLTGKRVYQTFGNQFPLLIKYIDAKEALSIQLHPHDDLAKERHDSFGKTEMWFVMHADKGANLIVGFNRDVTKEEYNHHLQNKSLVDILNIDAVQKGDVYFIPTGRVHAIGAGVLLAEIQQTSDITYRIYDWDRKDSEGNYRDLHTEEAIDAIDYKAQSNYKTEYDSKVNESSSIVKSPYFHTSFLPVKGTLVKDTAHLDSFVIYMCVLGSVFFESEGDKLQLNYGETVLVPASLNHFSITSQHAELLEITIP